MVIMHQLSCKELSITLNCDQAQISNKTKTTPGPGLGKTVFQRDFKCVENCGDESLSLMSPSVTQNVNVSFAYE